MIENHANTEKAVEVGKKNVGSVQIVYCLDRWRRNRLMHAVREWTRNLATEKEKEVLDEKAKQEMTDFKAKIVSEKDKTCKLLLQEFRENKATAVLEVKQREESRREEICLMAVEDVSAQLIRQGSKVTKNILKMNKTFEDEKVSIVESLNKQKNIALQETAARLRVEMQNTLKESERAHNITLQMTEKALRADKEAAIKEIRDEMEERMEVLRRQSKEECNNAAETEFNRLQLTIDQVKLDSETKVKEAVRRCEESHEKQIAEVKTSFEKKIETEKNVIIEIAEKNKSQAIALVQAEKHEALSRMQTESLVTLQESLKKCSEEKEAVVRMKDIEREKAIDQVLKQSREERESALTRLHEALQAEAAAKVQMSEKVKHVKEVAEKELQGVISNSSKQLAEVKEKAVEELKESVENEKRLGKQQLQEALKEQASMFSGEKIELLRKSEQGSSDALNKLNEHHQKVLETSLMAARNEMKILQQQLTKEKDVAIETFIDAARLDREKELQKQKEKFDLLLQDHLAEAEAIKNAEIKSLQKENEKSRQNLLQEAELIQAKTVIDAVREAEKAATTRYQQAIDEADRDKQEALENLKSKMRQESDSAIEELSRESELMMKALENRIQEMVNSNKALVEKNNNLQSVVEESDDANFDLQQRYEKSLNIAKAMRLRSAISAVQAVKAVKQTNDKKDGFWKAKIQEIEVIFMDNFYLNFNALKTLNPFRMIMRLTKN